MAAVTPVHIWKVGGSVIGVTCLGFAGWALFRNNTLFKVTDKVVLQNKVKHVGLFQQNGLDEEAFTKLVEHFGALYQGELDKVTAEKAVEAAQFHLAIQAQLNQAQLQKEQAVEQAQLQKQQAEVQAKLQMEQAVVQKEQAEVQATQHHAEVVEQAQEETKRTKEVTAAVTKVAYAFAGAYAAYALKEAWRAYWGR